MVLTDGNIMYWSLNNVDLTSSNPNDLSGNGNNGTNSGDVTTGVTGKLDEGFTVGTSTGHIASLIDEVDFPSDTASYSLWFKTNSNTSLQEIVNSSAGSFNDSPQIRLLVDGKIRARCRGSSNSITADSAASIFSTGVYNHIVATFTSTRVILYLNNVEIANVTGSTGAWGAWALQDWGRLTGSNSNKFKGEFDEIAVWNRALSVSEVDELYNSGAGFNPYASEIEVNKPLFFSQDL